MNDRKNVFDCVIVGAGAAGLSAAITLGRARRRALVCDMGAPRNAPADASHGFLTRDGTPPLELLAIGREQLEPYETIEYRAVGVTEIKRADAHFKVRFEDGATVEARKVLLAFGMRDEFPDIADFGEFWGKTVFHCPFCHGFEVRDRPLAVVGSGEAGFRMVALLKSWSADLVLCTDGASADLSDEQRETLAKHGVPVREEKIVGFEGAGGQLEAIRFEGGARLSRSGALIRPKQRLRSELAEKLGCQLTESGHIKVEDFNRTTADGVYAAGDITAPLQSIAVAVAQGAIAAGAGVNHALSEEDFV